MRKKVYLNNTIVSREEINNVIDCYKQLKIAPNSITEIAIVAGENVIVNEVDLLLIDCIILIKVEFPGTLISLNFPFNDVNNKNSDRILRKLTQAAIYAYLMTGKEVFTLKIGGVSPKLHFNDMDVFEKGTFVLSDSFMLFLYVSAEDEEIYNLLFSQTDKSPINSAFNKLVDEIEWDKSNDELRRRFRYHIINNVFPQDNNRMNCILSLGMLAFINVLFETHCLPIFANREKIRENPEALNALHISRLSTKNNNDGRVYQNYEYYEAIEEIFLDLAEKPLIFHFIFSTLTSSKLLPGEVNLSNRNEFIKKLSSLWRFTGDLVHSLTELAKNIRDHSSTKRGIISAHVIKSPNKQIIENIGEQSEESTDSFRLLFESNTFLNLHVIDLGEKGIIQSTYDNTKILIDSPEVDDEIKGLLKKDLNSIYNGTFKLESFFSGEIILNQQTKRSIAHFGLLILSELINSNDGLIVVSTNGQAGKTDIAVSTNKTIPPTYTQLSYGTHYDIFMPIDVDKPYKPHLPHTRNVVTQKELESIESLLDYDTLNLDTNCTLDGIKDKKVIYCYQFPDIRMTEKIAEKSLRNVYKDLIKVFPSAFESDIILQLNLEKVKSLDASALFRFLGYCESKTPTFNIIITHIENKILEELTSINYSYFKILPLLGFWNEKVPTIFLSYERDKINNKRFYFTDVFWGKRPSDFLKLNRLISITQFNSISLLPVNKITDINSHSNDVIPGLISPLFINGNVLLSIDLLLNHEGTQSIYENNAAFLLNAELI